MSTKYTTVYATALELQLKIATVSYVTASAYYYYYKYDIFVFVIRRIQKKKNKSHPYCDTICMTWYGMNSSFHPVIPMSVGDNIWYRVMSRCDRIYIDHIISFFIF